MPGHDVLALYHATAHDLFRYAVGLVRGDMHSAHELVQETFAAACEVWGKLRLLDSEHQRRWLFRVVRNKAATLFRKSLRLDLGLEPELSQRTSCDDVEQQVLDKLAIEKITSAIAAMRPEWAEVANLRWGRDLPVKEIACLLDCTDSAVRSRLKRARDQLIWAVGPDVSFLPDSEIDDGEVEDA